jgi:hypothetical protein
MINVSIFYSALLLVLAALLELLVILTNMFKNQDNDKEIRDKNLKFSQIPIACLMAMGALVGFVSSIIDIVNFRLAWMVNEVNGTYEITFQFQAISSQLYVIVDTLFILYIFYTMTKYLKQVTYRKYPGVQEGFCFHGERGYDILFFPFIFPHVYFFFMFIPIFFGVSLLLVALSWIPVGAISYVFLKNR